MVDVNGVTDRAQINQLVEVLPARDARFIKLAHISSTPKFDTSFNFYLSTLQNRVSEGGALLCGLVLVGLTQTI